MSSNNNSPAIRFAGYTGDWQFRTLGEIGKARSGVGFPDSEQGGKQGTPFFKVSDMNNIGNETEMCFANNYVTKDQIDSHHWNPIKDLPAIFFAKVGAAVLHNRKRLCTSPFLMDNNTMAYSMDASVWDASFSKALFDTIDLTTLIQVGALPSYNAKDVEALEVHLPGKAEQTQLGHFFDSVEALITLHQRKYEKLVNLKKAMLDKMFPKNGELVPAVRFAGFSGNWERRKLGELAEISSGVMGDSLLSEGTYRLTRIETISDGYVNENHVGYTNSKPSADFLLRDGDILYSNINSISHIGKVARFHSNSILYHGINLLRIRPNYNVNSDFLLSIFRTEKSQNWAKSRANQAVSQASINQTLLGTQQLPICSETEQRKVGAFISAMDNLITLHQRKYEKLVKIKSSFLEKMFV